jgi:hypothetical protein
VLFKVPASDSARDRRLPCTDQAVQPEDARLVPPISPAVYFAEEVDARIREASVFVLSLVRIEGRLNSVR